MDGVAPDSLGILTPVTNQAVDSLWVSGHMDILKLKEILSLQYVTTVGLIALVLGLAIIFIGYRFAGGIYNRKAIIFSIIAPVVLGVLTIPLLIKAAIFLNIIQYYTTWAGIMVIEMVFVAFVSAHSYEMTTVTAEEAHARTND